MDGGAESEARMADFSVVKEGGIDWVVGIIVILYTPRP